jgi:hypothetical protein
MPVWFELEVFVKFTNKVSHPSIGVAPNPAVGLGYTVYVLLVESTQPLASVTRKRTVYTTLSFLVSGMRKVGAEVFKPVVTTPTDGLIVHT